MHPAHLTQLDNSQEVVACDILAVQIAGYELEAQIIGVASFPGLQGTVCELQASHDDFIGVEVNDKLVAVVRIEVKNEHEIEIASLVVQPQHHRAGLASMLLEAVFKRAAARAITVATSERNKPAIALYAKHGFVVAGFEDKQFESIRIVQLRRERPNPSLKRSANGRPPGPVCGAQYSPQPGPGVLPSSPA